MAVGSGQSSYVMPYPKKLWSWTDFSAALTKSAQAVNKRSVAAFLRQAGHSVSSLFLIKSEYDWLERIHNQKTPLDVLVECEDVGEDWGKGDLMFDLAGRSRQERQELLQAAAQFGGALYLIRPFFTVSEENTFWEALVGQSTHSHSVAAVPGSSYTGPKRLFFLYEFLDNSTRMIADLNQSRRFHNLVNGNREIQDLVLYNVDAVLCSPVKDLRFRSLHLEGVVMDLEFVESLARLEKGSITHSLTLRPENGFSVKWLPCLNNFLEWSLEFLSLRGFDMQIRDGIDFMRSLQALATQTPLHSLSLGTVGNVKPRSLTSACISQRSGLLASFRYDKGSNGTTLTCDSDDESATPRNQPARPLISSSRIPPLCSSWHRSPISGKALNLDDEDDFTSFSTQGQITDVHDLTPNPETLSESSVITDCESLHPLQVSQRPSQEPSAEDFVGAVIDALHHSGLQFLHLDGFPLDPAMEAQLLRNRNQHPRVLFQRLYSEVPATALRLFLCGDPYSGKTTLVSSLVTLCSKRKAIHKVTTYIKRHIGLAYLSKAPKRTTGIEVHSLVRDNIRVSMWDMAGEREFHAFHDHMFPDNSGSDSSSPAIFLFVWSPISSKNEMEGSCKELEEFEASFRYWLKFIASKTRQSNVARKLIVVLTRNDQMDYVRDAVANSIRALLTSFSKLIDIVDVLEVDARSPTSVRPVASCIFKVAKALLKGAHIYSICNRITEYLREVSDKMPPIISWDFFRKVCEIRFQVSDIEVQRAIAFSLNESGVIIYLNNLPYIVVKPDWFCHEIIGSLIHFDPTNIVRTMPIRGYVSRDYLEKILEKSSQSEVDGAILVALMEGMHLCCKVPNDPHGTILIPATLPTRPYSEDGLHWQGVIQGLKPKRVYVGRRLQCDKKDLTFLTPGLFPMIQVVFKKAFGGVEADVQLQRDFLSIYIRNIEILVIFGLARGDHVIDVIMCAPSLANVGGTLTHVRKETIGTLIRICAQPVGNQGVKLVESVIRPDLLLGPTPLHKREDQCVLVEHLKHKLSRHLIEGRKPEELVFLWKGNQYVQSIESTYADLLGIEDYMEILESYRLPLAKAHGCVALKVQDVSEKSSATDKLENRASSSASHLKKDSTSYEQDDVICEAEQSMVSSMSKGMVRSIFREMEKMDAKLDGLKSGVDAIHESMQSRLDDMHRSIQDVRSDILSAIQTRVEQILYQSAEKEVGKVPRMVFLTSEDVGMRRRIVTALFKDVKAVRIELFCEHRERPHRVEGQTGLCITSMGHGWLKQALPYINGFLSILNLAAKVGAHVVAGPLGSALVPDFTELVAIASAIDAPGVLKNLNLEAPPATAFMGWQQWLVSVLERNGGMTESNIADKFMLRRAMYEDTCRVAWLCEQHYLMQQPLPLV